MLLFVLVLGFLYAAYRTLIAFLFAVFFAYLMDPAVSRLDRWVRGRGRAIALIYAFLIIVLATFFVFVGPHIARETHRLTESLPVLTAPDSLQQLADKFGREHGWSDPTIGYLKDFLATHRKEIGSIAPAVRVAGSGRRPAILASDCRTYPGWLFSLKDGRTFTHVLLSMVGARPQRELLEGVLADLNQMLAQFIRAQLTLAALSMLAYTSFLGLARVPYALVLGTAGGIMEFIPVVGPLVAGLLIVGVALLSSYPHWLLLVLFLLAWRMTQDYAISPRVMGTSVELHPLAAIFGVLAGGEIAGVLGIYLSIPVMATLRILFRRWRVYAEKRRFGPLNEYSFGTEISPRIP